MGRIERGADGFVTVRFERILDHPPGRVWDALTRPEEVALWFTEMTLSPSPGGRIFLDFGEQGTTEGQVVTWEPPHLLEYTWVEGDIRSRVRWELEPEGPRTRLTLVHEGLPMGREAEYGAGWHDFLDRLPLHLSGKDLSGWVDRYSKLLESYGQALRASPDFRETPQLGGIAMTDTNPNTNLSGISPYLTVRNAKAAADFYKRAFAAQEVRRMEAEDGDRLMHCHLRINDGDLMMSDEFPEHGAGLGDGPRGVTLHLAVDDADLWWNRAVEAGATVTMPLEDQFWGDRYGQLRDPFGHSWSIGAPVRT